MKFASRGTLTSAGRSGSTDLAITYDADDNAVLRGPLVDEAALHGVLIKVRDLALPLLEVHRVAADTQEGTPE